VVESRRPGTIEFMFDVRPIVLDDEDIADTARFLRLVWPKARHMTAAYLDWAYKRNPYGPAFGFNAFRDAQMVAHCVVQPLEARLHGKVHRGVLSLNAATHPDARGLGLYFDLAKRTYARAAQAGFEFGVAVTNNYSTPGFVKHIGFEHIGPLDVRIGIGPPPLNENVPASDFEKHWSAKALAWRLANPSVSYRSAADRLGEHSLVFGPAGFPGIQVIMGTFSRSLLPGALESRLFRAKPFRLWAGFDPTVDWRRSRYLPFPMRLRPSPLNFIFKKMGCEKPTPGRIRFMPIDFDDF
jgi:GNAT superfamily N-acetyltransferase